MQDCSDTGVPVGTSEQIRYRTELIQVRDLSDTGVPGGTTGLIQRHNLSDARVPVGTTGLNQRQTELIQIHEYP